MLDLETPREDPLVQRVVMLLERASQATGRRSHEGRWTSRLQQSALPRSLVRKREVPRPNPEDRISLPEVQPPERLQTLRL